MLVLSALSAALEMTEAMEVVVLAGPFVRFELVVLAALVVLVEPIVLDGSMEVELLLRVLEDIVLGVTIVGVRLSRLLRYLV